MKKRRPGEVIQTALSVGGCRGWSLAIYNLDLDPDGSQARRIVQLVGDTLWARRIYYAKLSTPKRLQPVKNVK